MSPLNDLPGQPPLGALFSPLFAGAAQAPPFQPVCANDLPAPAFVPLGRVPSVEEAEGPLAMPLTADELLAQARQQAAQIVADAQLEAATRSQEQVFVAVQTVRREHTEAFAEAARDLLAGVREQAEAWRQHLEREAAGLVIKIAQRVLHERFSADEAAIVPVVREALRPLAEDRRIRIVVAPQHQPALHAAYQELAEVLREEAQIEIVLSESVAPGGCVVQGDTGSIDARLDTRLRRLEEVVQETLISATAA